MKKVYTADPSLPTDLPPLLPHGNKFRPLSKCIIPAYNLGVRATMPTSMDRKVFGMQC
jgi:hypothetical protein